MIEWLTQNWWIVLIGIIYIISRCVKWGDSKKKSGAEIALDTVVSEISKNLPDNKVREIFEKVVGTSGNGIIDNPIAKLAIGHAVDKVIEEIEKPDTKGIPDNFDGKEHPLYKFANKAIDSEKTKNKIISGAKTTGVFVLKIIKTIV